MEVSLSLEVRGQTRSFEVVRKHGCSEPVSRKPGRCRVVAGWCETITELRALRID